MDDGPNESSRRGSRTMHADGRSACIVPRSQRGNSSGPAPIRPWLSYLAISCWADEPVWGCYQFCLWVVSAITSELDSYFVTKKMALDCMILFDLDFYFFNQYITGLVGKKGLQMHHASRWTLIPLRPRLIVFPTCVHTS